MMKLKHRLSYTNIALVAVATLLMALQSCSIILSHRKDKHTLYTQRGPWAKENSENLTDSLTSRIYKLYNTEGSKATPLMLHTPSNEAYSLYDVEAEHIILYFYDPSCKVCAAQTAALYKLFVENMSKGIMVYAVYTGNDKRAWERWIAEGDFSLWINVWKKNPNDNSFAPYNISPERGTIYLLNKDKVVEVGELNFRTLNYIVKKLM